VIVRPLRLTVKGFTCFKDEQSLEFDGLDLFAIAGPTGAGKSSLLDAMIYALYGKVPRVGKAYSELVSHGRDRMSITLDFRAGDRHLRVTRTGRRSGAARAQLEEIIDGVEKPIADLVRTVDAEVEKVLGLDYDAFTQAVVLPQGEFARFMRGEPKARRKILSDLLRLHIYERMRRQAISVRDALLADVNGTEKRLKDDYGGATQDAVDKLRAEVVALDEQNTANASRLMHEKEKHQRLRQLHEKTQELIAKRKRQQELANREPEVVKLRERLAAAGRAAAVVPLADQADKAEKDAIRGRGDADEARRKVERLRRVDEKAREDLKKNEGQAAKLPEMNRRIRALDELKGKLEARERERARHQKAENEVSKLLEQLREARAHEKEAAEELKRKDQVRKGAAAAVKEAGYNEALAERLEAVRDRAAQLEQLRAATDEDEKATLDAEAEAARKEKAATHAIKEAAAAETEHRRAKEALVQADQELHAAQHEDMAAVLRGELRSGKECPVCGQVVKKMPEGRRVVRLEAIRKQQERARKAEEKARSEAGCKRDEAVRAQEAGKSARDEATEKRSAADAARKRLNTAEQAIVEKVGKEVSGTPGQTIEERVLRTMKFIDEARKRHEKATKILHEAEKATAAGEAAAKRAAEKVKSLEERHRDKQGIVTEVASQIARLDEQIATVTRAPDPIAEREELAERCVKIDEARKQAQQLAKRRGTELAVANEGLSATRRALEKAQKTADDAKQHAREAASKAGFKEVSDVRRAAVTPAEERQLQEQIAEFERDKSAVEHRVGELRSELAGREIPSEQYTKSQDAVSALERELQAGRDTATKSRERLRQLEAAVEKANALNLELGQKRDRHALYAELELSLRSDGFQDYVLAETFHQLVAGASRRLMELSGRYELAVEESAFRVIDHDNALEQRSANTLSGGETFLASLALALELSQQVQRAAGAVEIDSLFIDEGFGTLDPETLDTVASAVEALPTGGRMVGIITHVRELTERLPARIIVEKGTDGSRLRRETD
jgi:exonuclease SbcC